MIKSLIVQYDSSTVQSAAYNYEHKTLTVHFNHGSYLYKEVDPTDWNLFNLATSQGKALNEFIKGKYDFEKLESKKVGSLLDELPPADYEMGN
jgi:hypothetical protein